jgi:hypothetical protein
MSKAAGALAAPTASPNPFLLRGEDSRGTLSPNGSDDNTTPHKFSPSVTPS